MTSKITFTKEIIDEAIKSRGSFNFKMAYFIIKVYKKDDENTNPDYAIKFYYKDYSSDEYFIKGHTLYSDYVIYPSIDAFIEYEIEYKYGSNNIEIILKDILNVLID